MNLGHQSTDREWETGPWEDSSLGFLGRALLQELLFSVLTSLPGTHHPAAECSARVCVCVNREREREVQL